MDDFFDGHVISSIILLFAWRRTGTEGCRIIIFWQIHDGAIHRASRIDIADTCARRRGFGIAVSRFSFCVALYECNIRRELQLIRNGIVAAGYAAIQVAGDGGGI